MYYILDIQGFKQPNNDHIVKELAIVPLLEDSNPKVFLFKPPYPWRKLDIDLLEVNNWFKCHHHGIPWKSGDIPYNEISNILREHLKDAKKVIVKGFIIKKWLKRFKFNVCNINEMGFAGYDNIYHQKFVWVCHHHNGAYKTSCAARNVKLLKKFYQENVASLKNMKLEDIDA